MSICEEINTPASIQILTVPLTTGRSTSRYTSEKQVVQMFYIQGTHSGCVRHPTDWLQLLLSNACSSDVALNENYYFKKIIYIEF